MTTTIEIPDSIANGFRSFATPLEDTWVTLLSSSLDFLRAHEQEFKAFRGEASSGTARLNGNASDPMVEGHLRRMSTSVKNTYDNFRQTALTVGSNVHEGAVPSYLRFSVAGRNFAVIVAQRGGLLVYVRPEATDLPQGGTTEIAGIAVQRAPRKNWPLDTYFRVDPTTNLEGVKQLLRQSYEAVS